MKRCRYCNFLLLTIASRIYDDDVPAPQEENAGERLSAAFENLEVTVASANVLGASLLDRHLHADQSVEAATSRLPSAQ